LYVFGFGRETLAEGAGATIGAGIGAGIGATCLQEKYVDIQLVKCQV
jgi:hypothetical protein